MKKEKTYRRFNFPSFLAILGCIGMLGFESIFIFELYDWFALQPESSVAVETAVEKNPESVLKKKPEPSTKDSVVTSAKKGAAPVKEVTLPVKEVVVPEKADVVTPVVVSPAASVSSNSVDIPESPEIKTEGVNESSTDLNLTPIIILD